jgi:hypothetical protein
MQRVTNKPIILSAVMLNVILLNVVMLCIMLPTKGNYNHCQYCPRFCKNFANVDDTKLNELHVIFVCIIEVITKKVKNTQILSACFAQICSFFVYLFSVALCWPKIESFNYFLFHSFYGKKDYYCSVQTIHIHYILP